MREPYEPPSDFLKAIIAEEISLSGSPLAEDNLRRLIAMTRDVDRSNRDWATLLLSQHDEDTPAIREALLVAVRDDDEFVRAEALLGIALRDTHLALPFAIAALSGESASMAVFEATALIADEALVDALRLWTETSDNGWLDQLAANALATCERGTRTA